MVFEKADDANSTINECTIWSNLVPHWNQHKGFKYPDFCCAVLPLVRNPFGGAMRTYWFLHGLERELNRMSRLRNPQRQLQQKPLIVQHQILQSETEVYNI